MVFFKTTPQSLHPQPCTDEKRNCHRRWNRSSFRVSCGRRCKSIHLHVQSQRLFSLHQSSEIESMRWGRDETINGWYLLATEGWGQSATTLASIPNSADCPTMWTSLFNILMKILFVWNSFRILNIATKRWLTEISSESEEGSFRKSLKALINGERNILFLFSLKTLFVQTNSTRLLPYYCWCKKSSQVSNQVIALWDQSRCSWKVLPHPS